MKNTPTITMPEEEAKALYKEYLELVKTRKEKYVEELKNVYRHLSEGSKVLDIYEVFKQSGVDSKGEPKLAIAVADEKTVTFEKDRLGAGAFGDGSWRGSIKDVYISSGVFPDWATEERSKGFVVITRKKIKTRVPLVPPHLMPAGKLEGYYILFEVTEWEAEAVPKDPYLLKRINLNAFVVLAEWDLTPVEIAVTRGL